MSRAQSQRMLEWASALIVAHRLEREFPLTSWLLQSPGPAFISASLLDCNKPIQGTIILTLLLRSSESTLQQTGLRLPERGVCGRQDRPRRMMQGLFPCRQRLQTRANLPGLRCGAL